MCNIHAIIAILSHSCYWKYHIIYIQYVRNGLIKSTAKQVLLIMQDELELNAVII